MITAGERFCYFFRNIEMKAGPPGSTTIAIKTGTWTLQSSWWIKVSETDKFLKKKLIMETFHVSVGFKTP